LPTINTKLTLLDFMSAYLGYYEVFDSDNYLFEQGPFCGKFW